MQAVRRSPASYWLALEAYVNGLGLILLLLIPLTRQSPIPTTADTDVATLLAAGYIDDPAATLKVARRVAVSSDPAARDVFVEWVHYVLAREFVPNFTANALRVRPLLDGLGEWTDAGGFTVHVTAGLRTWAEAVDTKDAATLRRLAETSFERAESYGGRYRLLIARLLDDREEPDLQARARAMRERLALEVRERHQGFPRPAFDQPYGVTHYWLGLALSREAELCRRAASQEKNPRILNDLLGRAAMHSHNAATATRNAVRRPDTWWLREAAMLRGPDEFLTADAALDEERAREFAAAGRSMDATFANAQALSRLAEATLVDGALFPLFERASARLRPDVGWAKVWWEGVLQHGSPLPFSSGKRWRILFVWDPACRTCDATIRTVEQMARESPDGVLIGTSRQHHEAAIAQLAARGVAVIPEIIPDDVLSRLGRPTVPYVIAPDGRSERLSLRHWEAMARAFLSVLPEKVF